MRPHLLSLLKNTNWGSSTQPQACELTNYKILFNSSCRYMDTLGNVLLLSIVAHIYCPDKQDAEAGGLGILGGQSKGGKQLCSRLLCPELPWPLELAYASSQPQGITCLRSHDLLTLRPNHETRVFKQDTDASSKCK